MLDTILVQFGLTTNDVADFLSIISFLISIYVAIKLKKIEKKYLFRADIPRLSKQIQKYNSELLGLNVHSSSYTNDLKLNYSLTKSVLISIERKAPVYISKRIKKVLKLINSKNAEDQYWLIYTEIAGLIEDLKNARHEDKWSR